MEKAAEIDDDVGNTRVREKAAESDDDFGNTQIMNKAAESEEDTGNSRNMEKAAESDDYVVIPESWKRLLRVMMMLVALKL